MSVNERLVYVRSNALCSNCLISGHKALECRKPFVCKINDCKPETIQSSCMYLLQYPLIDVLCRVMTHVFYMPIVPVVVNDDIVYVCITGHWVLAIVFVLVV